MMINTMGVLMYHNSGEIPYMPIPHLHSQLEIYYNISGGKSFFIDKNFYQCNNYDLFVVLPTHIHKAVPFISDYYERCIINIDMGIINSILNLPIMSGKFEEILKKIGTQLSHKITLCIEEHKKFISMIETYNNTPNGLEKVINLLEILNFVATLFEKANNTEIIYCKPETWSDKVILYIEQNFSKTISVCAIAKHFYVNENYLCKIFKQETQITIKKYILSRKIVEAKRLLYYGATVKEACIGAKFNNYSGFIRAFKQETGVSPGKLKELNAPL